jgi:hypothetical protein
LRSGGTNPPTSGFTSYRYIPMAKPSNPAL